MKIPALIFGLIMTAHLAIGQELRDADLKHWELKKKQLTQLQGAYQDSLNRIEDAIKEITSRQIREGNRKVLAKIRSRARVYKDSESQEVIGYFEANTYVMLISYEDFRYLAEFGGLLGYVKDVDIQKDEEVKQFTAIMEAKEKALKSAMTDAYVAAWKADKAERDAQTQKQRETMIHDKFGSRYGTEIIRKIADSEIWVGMSDEMAVYSLGKPARILTTINRQGSHEEWQFEGMTLSFQNGMLKEFRTIK